MQQAGLNQEIRRWNCWFLKYLTKLPFIAKRSILITRPDEILIKLLPKKPCKKLPNRINTSFQLYCSIPTWHKGVVGIVASRLIENYFRPTIILTESNGHATGSARSIPGFDLYQAITECADLLENYGGHMYAAGITLKTENIQKFRDRFEEVVKNSVYSGIIDSPD